MLSHAKVILALVGLATLARVVGFTLVPVEAPTQVREAALIPVLAEVSIPALAVGPTLVQAVGSIPAQAVGRTLALVVVLIQVLVEAPMLGREGLATTALEAKSTISGIDLLPSVSDSTPPPPNGIGFTS
jgi:hypothetical protein